MDPRLATRPGAMAGSHYPFRVDLFSLSKAGSLNSRERPRRGPLRKGVRILERTVPCRWDWESDRATGKEDRNGK